jgi:hypothetical protein
MDSMSSGSTLFGAISVSTTMRGLRSAAKDATEIATESKTPSEHATNRFNIGFPLVCRVATEHRLWVSLPGYSIAAKSAFRRSVCAVLIENSAVLPA